MIKKIKITLLSIVIIVLAIIITGMIKFNIMQDDIYIQQPDGSVIQANDIEEYTFQSDDGKTALVTYISDEKDVMFLELDTKSYKLHSALSGSGARYTNEDENITFWEHQGEITVTHNEEEIFKGILISEDGSSNSSEESIIGTWIWERTVMNNDTTIVPAQENVFTITFDETGSVSGTTDCNNFFGQYVQDSAGQIYFEPLASTLMFCENSQEHDFINKLMDVYSYQINSESLVLDIKLDSGSLYFKKQ